MFSLLMALAQTWAASAQSVVLDATFGTGGFATNAVGAGVDRAMALAVQADGRLVLGGHGVNDMALVRYMPDGVLDPTFGTGGVKVISFNGNPSEVRGVAIQPDGRILAAGFTSVPGPTGNPGNFVLLRHLPNGDPDPSFGNNGRVLTQVGSSSLAYCLLLQPDGRILVGGSASNGMAIARYLPDGTLDASFGTGGTRVIAFDLPNGDITGLALGPNGTILAVGSGLIYHEAQEVYELDQVLLRLQADGTNDATFGDGGMVIYDEEATANNDVGRAVLVQEDGNLVTAGLSMSTNGGDQFVMVSRYLPDGTPDAGFGQDGTTLTDINSNYTEVRGAVLQSDGKILVTGSDFQDIVLVRYLPNGEIDHDFGTDGLIHTDFGDSYEYGTAITLQPDGKVLVAAYTSYFCDDRDFAIVRYTNDITTAVPEGSASTVPLAICGSRGIIAADFTLDASASVGFIIRDALGRRVTDVQRGVLPPGARTEQFDISALRPGTYSLELMGGRCGVARFVVPE